MRLGVYARDSVPGAVDFCDGLAASGHEGILRSAPDWNATCFEPFDAVAVFGLQGKGQAIFDAYTDRGVLVVVIDYGYLKRTNAVHDWKTGHWQVSLGGLNQLPPFACPADRFDALGLEVAERGGNPKGYTLICVQTPDDKSHGMSRDELQAWCNEQVARYPDAVIRPHPLVDLDYGLPRCQAETLDEALAGARLVVTANSNAGHDALMAGVPVIGTMPAAWSALAGETLPSRQARIEHFRRCAYGQWTWDEFKTGAPQRFLIEHVMAGIAPHIDEQPAEPKRRGRPPKAKD